MNEFANLVTFAGIQHAASDAPRGDGLSRHRGHCHSADTYDSDSWHGTEIHRRQEM